MNCLVVLASADIYFKIRLHKILCKFTLLKKSTLTSSYFKSNFKLIKKVSKNICFIIFRHCLYNFVQPGEFYPCRILSGLEAFIQRKKKRKKKKNPHSEFGDFYLVQRLLSTAEIFIQHGDFYLVRRLLSSIDTFIQYRRHTPFAI